MGDWIAAITTVRPKILIIPNVLANRQSAQIGANLEGVISLPRLKITIFVKNVVSRQKRFDSRGSNSAVLEQGGLVGHFAACGPFISARETDHHRAGTTG